MPKVAIMRCDSYDDRAVKEAVGEAIRLCLGPDWTRGVKVPVLLKPNVLNPSRPQDGVCTHPAVLKAVIGLLREAGVRNLAVGDSSGGAGIRSATDRALEVSGLAAAAREMGVKVLSFDHETAVGVPNPRGPEFPRLTLAKPVLDAGWLVNIPKFKTHALTTLTATIKNLFGTVPGAAKRECHRRNPSIGAFANALVDIYAAVRPSFHIVDAIVAMEGEGPSGGPLRKLGLIVAGADGVAVDAVLAAIIGLDPLKVPTTRAAAGRGLGEGDLSRIEVVGTPIADVRAKRFRLPVAGVIARHAPAGLTRAALGFMVTRPAFIDSKCNRCATCVKSCPVAAMSVTKGGPVPQVDDAKCISCFCCHELCPQQAVYVRWRNPVTRFLLGGAGRGATRAD